MSSSLLERKPNRPMSSMGADSVSTDTANRPARCTAPAVKFSLLMATITCTGSAVTWVTVFTTQPTPRPPSTVVMTYSPQLSL